jgi:hypothetical protein
MSLPLAFQLPSEHPPRPWQYPRAWATPAMLLKAGTHSVVAQYGGDPGVPAMLTELVFDVAIGFELAPGGGFGLALASYTGVRPGVLPQGAVTLTELSTGKVRSVDIAALLELDPLDQQLRLKLPDGLLDDTLISYPGDANFPALSYTYDAQDVPAPGTVLPVAIAALAVLRRRRRPS